jgi:drug/metabolite transporter (DMT)-like permease
MLMLAFAAVYLIWGSTYLAIRVAVRSLPPFLMAGSRFLLAGGVLFAILRASGVAAPTRAQWRHAALSGLLMLVGGNGLVTWAEERIASNLAALLVSTVPLYVALLDWLRPGGRRPARPALVGIAIGLSGMLLLALPDRGALSAPAGAGVAAVLIAGLGWAAGSLYARYGHRHPHTGMASAQQMLAGGLALLGIGLLRGEVARLAPSAITLPSVLAFVYLTVFGSLVAFSAFGWLVVASSPALVSTTAYVNPVVAVILGWLLLGERLSPRALSGAALIVIAVVVMTLGGSPLAAARARWRARG